MSPGFENNRSCARQCVGSRGSLPEPTLDRGAIHDHCSYAHQSVEIPGDVPPSGDGSYEGNSTRERGMKLAKTPPSFTRRVTLTNASRTIVLFLTLTLLFSSTALAGPEHDHNHEPKNRSLSGQRFIWPTSEQVTRVLLLKDYNTRVVLLGTTLLGFGAGVVGVFMLLRKRSLVGDVVSHASFPGIALAFLIKEGIDPGGDRSLPVLLSGAIVAGVLGVLCTTAIRKGTRIKEDAALAIVLSVFFGCGVALFTMVQDLPSAQTAGLIHFIYGKASSMIASDVKLIAWATAFVLIVSLFFFKEFSLLCFDEKYAASQGWPVVRMDLLLMALVVGITVIGLQSVGLLLVVAMLIIPAAAARFWTDHLIRLTLTAAAIGGVSAYVGVVTSAVFPRLAAGAVIVLVGSMFFGFSMFFGVRRGVLMRVIAHWRLKRKIGRHHLLRAFYEFAESATASENDRSERATFDWESLVESPATVADLMKLRSWSSTRLMRLLAAAQRRGLVRIDSSGAYRLTKTGAREAWHVARNHRLWELYLIRYADIAPSHVDRDADHIEHILEPELLEELETLLTERYPRMSMPESPHEITT